jgi:hypothetical protein
MKWVDDPPKEEQFGSDEWVAKNFPEYVGLKDSVKVTVPSDGSNGITGFTSTKRLGNAATEMIKPWESHGFREAWLAADDDERATLAASVNYYQNGGKSTNGNPIVDPAVFRDMQYAGEDPQTGAIVVKNNFGTYTGGVPPAGANRDRGKGSEYGINGGFVGRDPQGNAVNKQDTFWHYTQKDFSPEGTHSGGTGMFVPGYYDIVTRLGILDENPTHSNRWTKDNSSSLYDGMKLGTSVYGKWGFVDWESTRVFNENDGARPPSNNQPPPSSTPPPIGGGNNPPPGGGNEPPFPGGPQPTGPQPTPGTNPATHGPGTRPPLDYGPAPFNPYPPGYDPYGGGGYSGYGHEAGEYRQPVFGGDSRWSNMYQDFLGQGIDISKYAPELGGSASSQQQAPPSTQSSATDVPATTAPAEYYDYYAKYINRPH